LLIAHWWCDVAHWWCDVAERLVRMAGTTWKYRNLSVVVSVLVSVDVSVVVSVVVLACFAK